MIKQLVRRIGGTAVRPDHAGQRSPFVSDRSLRVGSFTVLRFFAAFLVFWSHCQALWGFVEPSLPLVTGSLGNHGVYIFFAISGYLVGRSAQRGDPYAFLVSRTLRIQPGLTICILVTLLMLAPFSHLGLWQYLSNPKSVNYLLGAVTWSMDSLNQLPGVFTHQAWPNVNGSLWTLRYEVFCYGVLLAISLLGRRAILFAALVGATMVVAGECMPSFPQTNIELFSTYDPRTLMIFGGIFSVGVAVSFAGRDLLRRCLAAAFIACVLTWRSQAPLLIAWDFLLPLLSIYLGRFINLDRFLPTDADVSYGFYIYAFPVTQMMVTVVGKSKHYLTADVEALAVTIALAFSSWYLVEKPFLAMKPSLARRLRSWMAVARPSSAVPSTPPAVIVSASHDAKAQF